MNVLITGATGFVGSHLYEQLHQDSQNKVIGLARSESKWQEFNLPGTPLLGDLSDTSIRKWVTELPDDLTHVVHTAGIVHSFDKEVFDEINTKATRILFNALKERFSKLHFIFISSLAAAGPATKGRITEVTQPRPVSAYGRSKLMAETHLKENLPADYTLTIIRPPMVMGPRDPAVLDVFKMVKGKLILNTGLKGPHKRYSIICIFDLVNIIKKTMKRDNENTNTEIYFPSYPKDYSFGDIVGEISRELNVRTYSLPIPFPVISGLANGLSLLYKVKKHDLRLTPDKINELRPMAWICSGDKAQNELDHQYQWDLNKTVKVTIEDYQKRNWL